MKDKPRTEDQLLPYDIIEAATRGDITAINSVLAHFEGYIAALATRTLYDEHGSHDHRRPVCTPFHTGRLLALCELWQELLLYL